MEENKNLTEENKNLSENERVRLENKAAWKSMTREQKLNYYREYYLLPTVVVVALVALVVSFVVTALTPDPEVLLYVLTSGCQFTEEGEAALSEEMMGHLEATEEQIYVDDGHSYQTDALVLMAHLSAQEVDVLLMEEEYFEAMVNSGAYIDLREVFDEETLAAWEPYLVWTAGAEVEDPLAEEGEAAEERVACPYGIRLTGTDWLAENVYGSDVVMGLTYNARGPENGRDCISWIMEQVVSE